MKRQIIICGFCIGAFFLLVFGIAKLEKESNIKNQENELKQEINKEDPPDVIEIVKEEKYEYVIVEEQGRLTVYNVNEKTVFLETAIQIEFLPQSVRDELSKGLYFENEGDMYDFLESYSS